MKGATPVRLSEIGLAKTGEREIERGVPVETPITFEFAGLAYAVMLATPENIEDFAIGFALSEGLISDAAQLEHLDVAEVDGGVIVRGRLPDESAERLRERLRLRLTEGSCGLCGLQSIEEVLRPLPQLTGVPRSGVEAVGRALAELPKHQLLSHTTGATHAAAFCDADGTILAVREDIGRHNALDKLIGHCAKSGLRMAEGFVLLTARCSYELVEKTVRAGCPMLVTISAPTSLAIERAKQGGLTLVTLARSDTALVANDPHGVFK